MEGKTEMERENVLNGEIYISSGQVDLFSFASKEEHGDYRTLFLSDRLPNGLNSSKLLFVSR
jgi:hypothetical protein